MVCDVPIDDIKAAVIDLGDSLCRFGMAGQDCPRHLFSSSVNRRVPQLQIFIMFMYYLCLLRPCLGNTQECHVSDTIGEERIRYQKSYMSH